jgi:hypothetical protein
MAYTEQITFLLFLKMADELTGKGSSDRKRFQEPFKRRSVCQTGNSGV